MRSRTCLFFAAVPLRSVRPVIRKAKLQIVAHSGAPAPAAPFLPRSFNVGRWRAPELGLRRGSSRPPVPDFVRVLFPAVPAATFLWAPVHRAATVLPGGRLMSARSWPRQLPWRGAMCGSGPRCPLPLPSASCGATGSFFPSDPLGGALGGVFSPVGSRQVGGQVGGQRAVRACSEASVSLSHSG